MRVDAVVFDVGGVLELGEVVDAGGFPEALRRVVSPDVRSAQDLAARMGTVDAVSVAEGRTTQADFLRMWADALGVAPAAREAFRTAVWDWYCGELNVPLFEYARRLSGWVRVAILSNSAAGAREEEERRYGFSSVFDPVLYSHELGVAKPDPRAFERLASTLDLPPSRIAFLDDREENVAVASGLGFVALHFRDTHEAIAELHALTGVP